MKVTNEALATALSQLGAAIDAPECHGALVGQLVAGKWGADGFPTAFTAEVWVLGLLEGIGLPSDQATDTSESLAVLERLWAQTVTDLLDPDHGFTPVLPGDERPLGQRARAIGQWCAGFLSGLAEGGASVGSALTDDAQEIIEDFIEITRIEPSPAPDEEAEVAFAELVEYVRTGALLVAEELGAFSDVKPSDDTAETLH